ncbi:MAG: molybdopterin-dependent oxidoreductase [Microthrixaceae bacterium]
MNVPVPMGELGRAVAAMVGVGSEPAGSIDPEAMAAASELLRGDGPLRVVIGRRSLAEGYGPVADAVAALREARPDATFLVGLRRGNVRGALEMGLAPSVLPGRMSLDGGREWFAEHWHAVPEAPGLDAAGIIEAAADGRIRTLVLLGADPIGDLVADVDASAALERATVISLATHHSASTLASDIVMPVAAHAEVGGSTTNLEGRVTALGHRVTSPGLARADWVIAAELASRLGTDLGLTSIEVTRPRSSTPCPPLPAPGWTRWPSPATVTARWCRCSTRRPALAGSPERLSFTAGAFTQVPAISSAIRCGWSGAAALLMRAPCSPPCPRAPR